MSNVYIVTQGCYSDYGIVGVFGTRELADEYIQLEMKRSNSRFDNYYDVEEFTLNHVVPKPVYRAHLSVKYEDNVPVQNVWVWDKAQVVLNHSSQIEVAKAIYNDRKVLVFVGVVYGETRELAEKNAWDAIAKAKAEFLNL